MSIDNYGELKTAVANWIQRSDLTSRIPEFIALAEDRIGLDLRVRAMETSADITISAQTAALPTRFVQQRRIYLDTDSRRLGYYPPNDFWTRLASNETGEPKIFTIEGENFVFGPYPSSGSHTAKALYYAKFAALSADSDTNWLFTNARGLLLYGSLLEASPYTEDDQRSITWASLYEDTLERVHKADDRDRHPDAALEMRSTVYGG